MKQIVTKLQSALKPENVPVILDNKLEETDPETTVDYIGLAEDKIKREIESIDAAIIELKAIKGDLKQQGEVIKNGTRLWLDSHGIDKLKGHLISSITAFNPKEKEELIIDNEQALIDAGYFKVVLDTTAVENAIKEGKEVEGAHIQIVHQPESIRINRRRR